MIEIPDFLHGIDPDAVRDLEQQMERQLDHRMEREATVLEAHRQAYLEVLDHKHAMIEVYFEEHNPEIRKQIGAASEMAHDRFLQYIHEIFGASEMINKPLRLAEAFSIADDTQQKVNDQQIGQPRICEMGEWQSRIAVIMSQENPADIKQGIIDLYDQNLREVVLRFMHDA